MEYGLSEKDSNLITNMLYDSEINIYTLIKALKKFPELMDANIKPDRYFNVQFPSNWG